MENLQNKQGEFRIIYQRKLADIIKWMTGESYYKFTNNNRETYSFKNTKKFNKAYDAIMNTREEIMAESNK